MTEAEALKKLKKGSEEALAWFIDTYTPYVTTVIQNVLGPNGDIGDVEEVASDVFYTLWQNGRKVHSVKGFLGTVARNKAKNKCREMRWELSLDERIIIEDEKTPETMAQRKELSIAVQRAVLAMPQPEREIFLRFYYYCQTMEAISTEMDINLSTVKTKLRRGRMQLAGTLKKYLQ